MFRRHDPDPDDAPRRRPDRSWSARLARGVLVAGAALLVARVTLATVVRVRGDGMAPTILDGEHILVLRGRMSVARGDVVLYEPEPRPAEVAAGAAPEQPDAGDGRDGAGPKDAARRAARKSLRNTAVVDPEELEDNWRRVQARSEGLGAAIRRAPALRVGRVLALPGDEVTFHVPDVPLGILVAGEPVVRKGADPLRVALRGERPPSKPPTLALRTTAYETVAHRRFRVILDPGAPSPAWRALELPPAEAGPVQVTAEGYLVLADNRMEGACCDSRALGWIDPDAVRGEVVARLSAPPAATPDLDPQARGFTWSP